MKTKQFTETFIDYVDGKIRREALSFKLTLGGRAGPGGGDGLPWNGIIGQLVQKRVAYDTTASASPCFDPGSGYWLASGSLLDNLNFIRYHQLPATWFETSPTSPRGLSVNVASGVWYDGENSYFIFSGGVSPTFTLPINNPRIDVVYVTSSGTIGIQQGIEAASPGITMPTASGVLPAWAIYLPPFASGIGYPCETYSGYLYQDLRPFMSYPPGGGGGGISVDCHQGSLIIGDATNSWIEFPIGPAGTVPLSNGVTAAWAAVFDAVLPTTITPDAAGAVGVANFAARRDHEHPIACDAPASPSVDLAASTEGGSTSFARSDHAHQLDQSIAPTWTGVHLYQNPALNTANPCYVIEIDYIKTAGATTAADDMAGIYSIFELDQVGGTIGDFYGAYFEARIDNGTVGANKDMWGVYTFLDLNGGALSQDAWGLQAKIQQSGTTIANKIWGIDSWIDLDTGSVGDDVIGISTWIDIGAGYTSPGSDVFGFYAYVDVDVAPSGTVYMVYLDEQDGIDYGVYQSGTAYNYFGGRIGVRNATSPACAVHAEEGICEIRVEYTNTGNYGRYSIYENATWKAFLDIAGSTFGTNYLQNSFTIYTNTGDIHLQPGSTYVGINLSAAPTAALDMIGNLYVETGYVGIGRPPSSSVHFAVQDLAVNTAGAYYGTYSRHDKTAGGATGADYFGTYSYVNVNEAAGGVRDLYGAYTFGALNSGTIRTMYGMNFLAQMNAGTATSSIYGTSIYVDINAGAGNIGGNVYGLSITVPIANMTSGTITGNVYGEYMLLDVDEDPTGAVYAIYIGDYSNVDWCFYQAGYGAPNYFAGNVGLGATAWGAGATYTLAIANGTAPASWVANEIQIYSKDSSSNAATLALWLEQGITGGTFTPNTRVKIYINGVEYYWGLQTV